MWYQNKQTLEYGTSPRQSLLVNQISLTCFLESVSCHWWSWRSEDVCFFVLKCFSSLPACFSLVHALSWPKSRGDGQQGTEIYASISGSAVLVFSKSLRALREGLPPMVAAMVIYPAPVLDQGTKYFVIHLNFLHEEGTHRIMQGQHSLTLSQQSCRTQAPVTKEWGDLSFLPEDVTSFSEK